jgi:hypothetical protein
VGIYVSTESVTIMILNEPPPPIAAKTAFLDGLGQPDSAQPLFSHQTFVLSLPELASDAKVLRPRRVGWQFVTQDRAGVAVAGEVPDTPDGTDPGRKSTTSF